MPLRHYVPLSLAVFVGVFALTSTFNVPFLPFALILVAGETLLGFQIEDHRIPRLVKSIFRRP